MPPVPGEAVFRQNKSYKRHRFADDTPLAFLDSKYAFDEPITLANFWYRQAELETQLEGSSHEGQGPRKRQRLGNVTIPKPLSPEKKRGKKGQPIPIAPQTADPAGASTAKEDHGLSNAYQEPPAPRQPSVEPQVLHHDGPEVDSWIHFCNWVDNTPIHELGAMLRDMPEYQEWHAANPGSWDPNAAEAMLGIRTQAPEPVCQPKSTQGTPIPHLAPSSNPPKRKINRGEFRPRETEPVSKRTRKGATKVQEDITSPAIVDGDRIPMEDKAPFPAQAPGLYVCLKPGCSYRSPKIGMVRLHIRTVRNHNENTEGIDFQGPPGAKVSTGFKNGDTCATYDKRVQELRLARRKACKVPKAPGGSGDKRTKK